MVTLYEVMSKKGPDVLKLESYVELSILLSF